MTISNNYARPLALDQVSMEATFYGVPISVLGEDGEQGFACITSDRRRAVAATVGLWRQLEGRRPFRVTVAEDLQWVWFYDHCGCPSHEPDPESGHADCECPHWGLSPCHPEVYAWTYDRVEQDTPGALPVYITEVTD